MASLSKTKREQGRKRFFYRHMDRKEEEDKEVWGPCPSYPIESSERPDIEIEGVFSPIRKSTATRPKDSFFHITPRRGRICS